VLDAWQRAKREVSVFYQPATDRRPWVAKLRHGRELPTPQEDTAGDWAY